MEVNISDDRRLVEVWLTNAEKDDPAVRESLKPLYAKYKAEKYLVAVYASGGRDLYQSTLNLLSYNQKRVAELAVRQERRIPLV